MRGKTESEYKKMIKALIKKKGGKINDNSRQGFPMAKLFHSKMPTCIKNAPLYLPQWHYLFPKKGEF